MKSFPSNHAPIARRSGFTILELLVAMSLLILMGGGLAALLGHGVRVWSTAEQSARAYEEARAVLDRVAEDLRSVVVRRHSADGDDWVRFLADADDQGHQRLRLVRTVSGEASDPILREGGRYVAGKSPSAYDGRSDAEEAAGGTLEAPGGLLEVMYFSAQQLPDGPGFARAVRSPVGGADSLFLDQKEAPHAAAVSSQLRFLGFSFWAPTTNTWDPVPALKDPKPGEASGPSLWWDSTRALLETQGASQEFEWRRAPGSLDDPSDDLFPELVEVTVVVADRNESLGVRLEEDIGERDGSLALSREIELPENAADCFVLVDDEWIEVAPASGMRLDIAKNGRGGRFTKPAKHERGAMVQLGLTLRRVIEMPCFRTERKDADRQRGKSRRRK